MIEVDLANGYYELRDHLYAITQEINEYGDVKDPFTELEGDAQSRYLWLLDARDSLEEALESLGRLMK